MQFKWSDAEVFQTVLALATLVQQEGGRALVVGGAVRDAVLGRVAYDVDIEVYGIPAERLEQLLDAEFGVDRVGLAFGILKLKHLDIDVSLPRRESKAGLGHRGFEVMTDAFMTIEEASARRDFTFNSMLFDPLTSELIDPHGGQDDLERGLLRHTNAASFHEDPLRVLRAVQLSARLELTAHAETLALCASIPIEGLARERLLGEFQKLLVAGVRPSNGLAVLKGSGWTQYFPELAALIETDPQGENRPDAWERTASALDQLARTRGDDEREELIIGLATLCHAMPAHATVSFLSRLINSPTLLDPVKALTAELRAVSLEALHSIRDGDIRRIAWRVGRFDRFVRVLTCREAWMLESAMQPDWWREVVAELEQRSEKLGVRTQPPERIMMGRHLLALGERPGRHLGPMLDRLFELQLEGAFSSEEEGSEWARRIVRMPPLEHPAFEYLSASATDRESDIIRRSSNRTMDPRLSE